MLNEEDEAQQHLEIFNRFENDLLKKLKSDKAQAPYTDSILADEQARKHGQQENWYETWGLYTWWWWYQSRHISQIEADDDSGREVHGRLIEGTESEFMVMQIENLQQSME